MKKRPRSEAETRSRLEAARYCCAPIDTSLGGGMRDVRATARAAYEREHGIKHYYPVLEVHPGDGRTCAVVGNAKSILDQLNGEQIDSHDVVVRINSPTIIAPGSQGIKIHYLFVTANTIVTIPPWPLPYAVVNISDPSREIVTRWSEKLRVAVGDDRARPSTGFIAIMCMIEQGYKVNIFGFDWFATPSLSCSEVWKRHYPEWERMITLDVLAGTEIQK